jgi:hypothetical protein
MAIFEAHMRVVHLEIWSVEATDETEARKMISDMAEDVETDETGGETVDWEIMSLKTATHSSR